MGTPVGTQGASLGEGEGSRQPGPPGGAQPLGIAALPSGRGGDLPLFFFFFPRENFSLFT